MNSSEIPTKQQLRAQARQQRTTLEMTTLSRHIQEQLAPWSVFQQAQRVLAFAPLPDEVDLLPLIAEHPQKAWYLPRIHSPQHLEFHLTQPGTHLITGPFGIQEPEASAPTLGSLTPTDLVLVPALLVDREGHRLGYGKGYYDRFLASLNILPVTACPIPQALLVECLPKAAWDFPVQWAVTESGLVRF